MASKRSSSSDQDISAHMKYRIRRISKRLDPEVISKEEIRRIVEENNQTVDSLKEIEGKDYELGSLQEAFHQTERILDRLLNSSEGLSDKSIKIIQTNGIFLTIIASASTQVDPTRFINGFTGFGLSLLFISFLLAAGGYFSRPKFAGYSRNAWLLILKPAKKEFLIRVLQDYDSIIEDGPESLASTSRWVESSWITLLFGFVLFTFGIFMSVV